MRSLAPTLALALVPALACHRKGDAIAADAVDASPRPTSKPSAAPAPSDAFTSSPLPAKCPFTRVLTTDAWLTLAFVRGHALERDEGQCDVYDEGARWVALGPFGERTGEVERVSSDDEGTILRLVAGNAGAKVYVRGEASFASYAEVATSSEASALQGLFASGTMRRRVFFRGGAGLTFAAVETEHGLQLLEEKGASWDRVYVAEDASVAWPAYDLRAILDVNDDGMPEVIAHFDEYADGRGFDIVVQRTASGDWDDVADNEDRGP